MGRRQRRAATRRTAVAALLAASALLVGACTSSPGGSSSATVAPTRTPATEPAPLSAPLVPTGDTGVDASLLEVARAVEEARGHPFLRPVTVQLLDDDAFTARASATDEPGEASIRRQEAVLEAVGAIPPGFDLVAAVAQEAGEDILGFYDPESEELVVRGPLTPFSQVVVAHELTHALDDQWFPLDALSDPSTTDDEAWALSALVEGSAQEVEQAYRTSLPAAVRGEISSEEEQFAQRMDLPELPPDLYGGLTDVYDQGLDLVRAIVGGGGTAALDAAFRSPPVSSEQVLHVDRYRAGDAPVAVTEPVADAPVTGSGQLGEAGLLDLLQLRLAPVVARDAATGWGGDRFVVWATPTGSCLRVDVALDDATEALQLRTAFEQWAAAGGGATVGDGPGGTVRLTSCR